MYDQSTAVLGPTGSDMILLAQVLLATVNCNPKLNPNHYFVLNTSPEPEHLNPNPDPGNYRGRPKSVRSINRRIGELLFPNTWPWEGRIDSTMAGQAPHSVLLG